MTDRNAIVDYVRANRGQYTREAIREALVAAGHAPEEVDGVLDEEFRLPSESIDVRRYGLLILAIAYVLGAVVIGLVWDGSAKTFSAIDFLGAFTAGLIFLLPALLVGIVVILIVNRKRVSRAQAMRSLLVGLAVPMVVLLAMTGICVSLST
jgi:hypothetical protein